MSSELVSVSKLVSVSELVSVSKLASESLVSMADLLVILKLGALALSLAHAPRDLLGAGGGFWGELRVESGRACVFPRDPV